MLSGAGCEYGCDIGDNRAIHEFRRGLQRGTPVVEAIAEAEKAQVPGIAVEVSSFGRSDCQRGDRPAACRWGNVHVWRQEPSAISLTSDGATSRFSTRQRFTQALAGCLEPPLDYGGFRLDFWRVGGYPNHDFIDVRIDSGGKITSVGEVMWAE